MRRYSSDGRRFIDVDYLSVCLSVRGCSHSVQEMACTLKACNKKWRLAAWKRKESYGVRGKDDEREMGGWRKEERVGKKMADERKLAKK